MSERLARLDARIATTRQLASLIGAMRAVAAGHVREAQARVDSVRAYTRVVGTAIADALSLDFDRRQAPSDGRRLVIALCAEQGFAGAYSERILDAVQRGAGPSSTGVLFLVGSRGSVVAEERGWPVAWEAPMVARSGQAALLAQRIARRVYARLAEGGIGEVSVVHGLPDGDAGAGVSAHRLFPVDFRRFPERRNPHPPLVTMAPETLIARLAEEYVFAMLCEAIVLSFAAENAARMRAMVGAQNNVERRLGELIDESRRARQSEITAEIIELAAHRRPREAAEDDDEP